MNLHDTFPQRTLTTRRAGGVAQVTPAPKFVAASVGIAQIAREMVPSAARDYAGESTCR